MARIVINTRDYDKVLNFWQNLYPQDRIQCKNNSFIVNIDGLQLEYIESSNIRRPEGFCLYIEVNDLKMLKERLEKLSITSLIEVNYNKHNAFSTLDPAQTMIVFYQKIICSV